MGAPAFGFRVRNPLGGYATPALSRQFISSLRGPGTHAEGVGALSNGKASTAGQHGPHRSSEHSRHGEHGLSPSRV